MPFLGVLSLGVPHRQPVAPSPKPPVYSVSLYSCSQGVLSSFESPEPRVSHCEVGEYLACVASGVSPCLWR